jgi:phosphoribosylaminoimidazole-succinocarboxamide synthase
VVLETSRVYIDAFERITGQTFALPPKDVPVLERVRRNLKGYFGS